MAVKSLESQVREALIQQRADELIRYASENPSYKIMSAEIVETAGDSMIEFIASSLGDVDEEMRKDIEEGRKEMLEEYKTRVLPQLMAQINDPQQIRKIMEEEARNQHISPRQLKAKIGSLLERLRAANEIGGIDETALQGFEKSFEGMFQYARTNDKFIRRLVAIAKQEGLDAATQKETGYKVIRELFPTPDDYRAHASRGIEEMRKFFQQAQGALTADGMAGQVMGNMIGAMGKIMEKALEIRKRIEGDYLEKTIREIYG